MTFVVIRMNEPEKVCYGIQRTVEWDRAQAFKMCLIKVKMETLILSLLSEVLNLFCDYW